MANRYYEQQLLSEPIAKMTVATTGSTSSVSLLILNCPANVKAIADHEELEAHCFNPGLACRAQRGHQATHGTELPGQESQARLPLDTLINSKLALHRCSDPSCLHGNAAGGRSTESGLQHINQREKAWSPTIMHFKSHCQMTTEGSAAAHCVKHCAGP